MGDKFKTCSGCLKAKPQDGFHLKGLDKSGIARLQSCCKECANKNRVKRYQKRQALKKRLPQSTKKFDLAACDIKIIYPACTDSSQVMADYIEAVYAISWSSSVKQ